MKQRIEIKLTRERTIVMRRRQQDSISGAGTGEELIGVPPAHYRVHDVPAKSNERDASLEGNEELVHPSEIDLAEAIFFINQTKTQN